MDVRRLRFYLIMGDRFFLTILGMRDLEDFGSIGLDLSLVLELLLSEGLLVLERLLDP